jgi:uroporphyrinogen-III synthase
MAKIYSLNNLKFKDVINIEVFAIEFIESNLNILDYDALIFTSKNAIYAIDSFNKEWINVPSYAIAPKTAEVINKANGKLVFTGISSHGNEFAQELIPLLKDKKVLYIKAEKTVSSLMKILKNNDININELVTYKTSCKSSSIKLEKDSVIIFSSPSSVNCFFKNYEWDKSYKAVVIGKTTANYLPNNINYTLSSKTSIEECINLAKQLLL